MRYVIDVTQLVHWSGNLTGIPRVMDELALRFSTDKTSSVIFVSWVKELGKLCEIDFTATRRTRGKHIAYRRKISATAVAVNSRQTVDTVLNGNASRLSKKAIKKIAAKSRFDRTPLYKKIVADTQTIETKTYQQYVAASSDKLFIPWGEWWDQNWLDLIKDCSLRGVAIYPVTHDILPMVVPQFSGNSGSLANFVSQIFPLATRVLAVSKSSKQDVSTWMKQRGLEVPPIDVFRLGEDFSIKNIQLDSKEMQKKYDVTINNYLIFVSTIEPRKNHQILYYTYKLAKSRGIILPKLIIVGRIGHDVELLIKTIREDPDTADSISIQNNVDDSDLHWLYQNSMFAVLPSFYEGWGMSVLESITRGKPVVCSATSSLLEMPQDCVLYFNPASSDECLGALLKMTQADTLKKYTSNTKKYKAHSWDESYKQVLAILDK